MGFNSLTKNPEYGQIENDDKAEEEKDKSGQICAFWPNASFSCAARVEVRF